MTAINREEAEVLYAILDETIGVFRQAEMPEGAVKFHNQKRDEFIRTYTEDIPDSFWFQGVDCPSALLVFDSTGFKITVPSEGTPRKTVKIVERANERIDEIKFTIIG